VVRIAAASAVVPQFTVGTIASAARTRGTSPSTSATASGSRRQSGWARLVRRCGSCGATRGERQPSERDHRPSLIRTVSTGRRDRGGFCKLGGRPRLDLWTAGGRNDRDVANSWTKRLAADPAPALPCRSAREEPLDPSPEVTLERALDSALALSLDLSAATSQTREQAQDRARDSPPDHSPERAREFLRGAVSLSPTVFLVPVAWRFGSRDMSSKSLSGSPLPLRYTRGLATRPPRRPGSDGPQFGVPSSRPGPGA
jgi:hypothetical protein